MSIPAVDLLGLLNDPPPPLDDDGKSVTARLLLDSKCELAECILYDDVQDAIVFTNILGRKFCKLKLSLDDGSGSAPELQIYDLPKHLGAFALRPAGEPGYLAAWEDGFQLYDFEAGRELSGMSVGESVHPLGLPDRLNDGRCAPDGRYFICGGCVKHDLGVPLKVFNCTTDEDGTLIHEPIIDNIQTANSTCWSLDGKKMYFASSPTRTIVSYDYDAETGKVDISSEKIISVKREELGVPDGSIVDADGYIWNATWRDGKGTGMVVRIDPDTGDVIFTVYLPDDTSQASCCCLGGPDMDILFITTARENLKDGQEPNAGGIYAVKLMGIKGNREARFVGRGKTK